MTDQPSCSKCGATGNLYRRISIKPETDSWRCSEHLKDPSDFHVNIPKPEEAV